MYVNNVKPYWGDSANTINLESEKGESKPWFDIGDDINTINTIKPEKIAKGILDSLSIDYDYEYESVFFGENYDSNDILIDLVPGDYPPFTVNKENASIRMDLRYDEDFLLRQLEMAPYDVYSNKPIPEKLLLPLRKKINRFFYIIDEDDDPNFAQVLQKLSIEYLLITYLDPKIVTKKKIGYMDHGSITNLRVEGIDALKNEEIDNLFYLSSKILIDKGIIYTSEYAWRNMLASNDVDSISKFENHPSLLKDSPHLKIMKKPIDKK